MRGEKYYGKICTLHPELNGLRHKTSFICTKCVRERARTWRADNPKRNRHNNLMRKYGITYDQFRILFETQGECCAICQGIVPGGSGDWHVDHDHATDKVRGVLCSPCNTALGMFRDDAEVVRLAAYYLDKHK